MRYTRRAFMHKLAVTGLLFKLGLSYSSSARAETFAATTAALRQGVRGERKAYTHYRVFGVDAAEEGYRGISYLFGAVALSELIHAH